MKVPDPNLPFGLRQRDIDAAYGDVPDKPERDPDALRDDDVDIELNGQS